MVDSGKAELCVWLLPSRTGTKWFHDLVLKNKMEIRYLRGRLKFGGSKNSAPFDSIIVVYKGSPTKKLEVHTHG